MNREPKNRKTNNLPDLFDEALEMEETVFQHSYEEPAFGAETTAQPADPIPADPTFYDEQVINVPMIDPPDMKSISSYPDAQIYDHLFTTDDDFLLDEEAVEDVITSLGGQASQPDIAAPENEIEEPAPSLPDPEPVVTQKMQPAPVASVPKPSKKPPVRRAGMPKKEEIKAEEPAVIEAPDAPVHKKPRVKRAGEKAAPKAAAKPVVAPAAPAAEETDAPPIALMELGTPKKAAPKKTGSPQKRPNGKAGTPQKKSSGNRPSDRPEAKPHSAKRERPRPEEEVTETRKAPEEKALPKMRPFSALEKMKRKLAEKWS